MSEGEAKHDPKVIEQMAAAIDPLFVEGEGAREAFLAIRAAAHRLYTDVESGRSLADGILWGDFSRAYNEITMAYSAALASQAPAQRCPPHTWRAGTCRYCGLEAPAQEEGG